jgi:hypothetical protein
MNIEDCHKCKALVRNIYIGKNHYASNFCIKESKEIQDILYCPKQKEQDLEDLGI